MFAKPDLIVQPETQSESKMRLVWIKSDYVFPPDTGGKIRTYNLLRQLHRRCNVTYMSLRTENESEQEESCPDWASQVVTFPYKEEYKHGLRFCLHVLAAMFSRTPYTVQKYRSRPLRDQQRYLADSRDGYKESNSATVLICDFLEMTDNIDWSTPCPKVLFQHNVESVIWRRHYENATNWLKKAYFWFEHHRLKRFESQACNRFDLVLTVSEKDKEILQFELGVTAPIEVIETGVDVEYFSPRLETERVPGRLLFLGSLDWMPNIDGIKWFVQEVYPTVKAACPHVTLNVVGRRPTAEIEELCGSDSSITVSGSVPDVRPYMAESDLFIVPLRIGGGTRLKIYEAMAMRCPVVSTTVGTEGLPLEPGRHHMRADSAPEFAATIQSMLANPSQKQSFATNGYDHVAHEYSWNSVSKHMHDVFVNLQHHNSARS